MFIGVDADSGLAHTAVTTATNVNDVTQAHALPHGEEPNDFDDAGYTGVTKREEKSIRKEPTMKEVQMTFRVDLELRISFTEAAELDHRPAAQVLREFMRTYVSQTRERAAQPTNDIISDAERKRRQDAVNFSRANVGLEGFKPSAEAEAHAQRFINGEIDLKEFAQIKAKADLDPTPGR
jgi:hypothetical protein